MLESGFYNMDCMDGMAQFPDKFFELAIVDPPYGIGMDSRGMNGRQSHGRYNVTQRQYQEKVWDDEPCGLEYFQELRRVSKNQIIWGANHFIENNPINSSCWIVWYKNGQSGAPGNADCELAWTSFKTAVRMFRYDWSGFGHINAKEARIHPTQKPIALYKWLLSNYAKPGDKILDTHVGSASSLIACHQMGFEYWGFELDTDYFNAATERLNRAKAQVSMAELIKKPTIDQIKIV